MYILTIVHEVMYFCGISEVDPGVTAEVAIRLALVLENNATNDIEKGTSKYDFPTFPKIVNNFFSY